MSQKQQPIYRASFPADQQVSLEEKLAQHLFDNTQISESYCQHLSKALLLIVVQELRPGLLRKPPLPRLSEMQCQWCRKDWSGKPQRNWRLWDAKVECTGSVACIARARKLR